MKANIRKVTLTFTTYISYPENFNYADMNPDEFHKLALVKRATVRVNMTSLLSTWVLKKSMKLI